MAKKLSRHILAMIVTVIAAILLSATMVRFAPGFDTDERLLRSDISEQTAAAVAAERARDANLPHFYETYFIHALQGDLGQSRSLNRPVRELIADRSLVTFRLIAEGLLVAWFVALPLASVTTMSRAEMLDLISAMLSGLFLCFPVAVLAVLFVISDLPPSLAIALTVFPKIYRYSRNLLEKSYGLPHILAARSRGLTSLRVLFWHVIPSSAPQIIALGGVSVTIALGAAIPVEALCGLPGLGALAWQAAIGRDLPLLVTLTALVTLVTMIATSISDSINDCLRVSEV
jgi:peptide/nickel transport system permease protein